MVPGQDNPKGVTELVTGHAVLTMGPFRFNAPLLGDPSDRKVVLEPESEHFDAARGFRTGCSRHERLSISGLTQDHSRPLLIECTRLGDGIELDFAHRRGRSLLTRPQPFRFGPSGNVAHNSKQERPETAWPPLLDLVQHPARAKTLDEDVLNRIIHLFDQGVVSPPAAKISSNHVLIATHEL